MQTANTKLFIALIILVGFVGGYLSYSSLIAPNEEVILPPATNSDLAGYKNLKINFEIFKNPSYKELAIFGQIPVSIGVTGKKDVFAPGQ